MTNDLAAMLARATAQSVDPLQDLLSRAKATISADKLRQDEAKRIDQQRKALLSGLRCPEERASTRNAIQSWENKHVWQTVGKVAVFTRNACLCGECHTVFSHWMLEQVHREVPTRKRKTRATPEVLMETADMGFGGKPSVGFQENHVEMCPVCAMAHEVDLSKVPVFEVLVA